MFEVDNVTPETAYKIVGWSNLIYWTAVFTGNEIVAQASNFYK